MEVNMNVNKPHCKHNEKGTAMALALLFSVILLGVGLALVYLTYLEEITSSFAVQGSQAFYPADVETAYASIGRTVVSNYGNWNDLLGLNATSGLELCTMNAPPACADEIASNYEELQSTTCKGRILRVPNNPDPGWIMTDYQQNPFRLRCDSVGGSNKVFCNCQMFVPVGASFKAMPQRITLYVRNDPADPAILQEQNGEIQLIAVSRMPSLLVEGAATSSIIAFDLTAWSQAGKIYDIHQTGSYQTISGQ
jgi:hypothetical protein